MKNPLNKIDDIAKNAFKIIPFISVLAPSIVILCAIGMSLAVLQVQKALAVGGETAAMVLQKSSQPKLDTVHLDARGYIDAANILSRLNPSVSVSYKKEGDVLQVAIQEASLLPEWIYVLSTVQGYKKGLVWTASEMCLKKCDGGYAATAELKAFTQKISIDNPTD